MRMPTFDEPLRVVELFSGIGAQAMALRLQGIPHVIVGTSEIDAHAMRSYEAYDAAVAARVSKTQLYKQAGNSIVVPVLQAIFAGMYQDGSWETVEKNPTLDDYLGGDD